MIIMVDPIGDLMSNVFCNIAVVLLVVLYWICVFKGKEIKAWLNNMKNKEETKNEDNGLRVGVSEEKKKDIIKREPTRLVSNLDASKVGSFGVSNDLPPQEEYRKQLEELKKKLEESVRRIDGELWLLEHNE